MPTTCQICARQIKSNTGVIAHHGYLRPGQGWQTSSCFGARYKPYEKACDALQPYIEMLERYKAEQQKLVNALKRELPRGFTTEPDRHFSRPWLTVLRPAGLTPKSIKPDYTYGSYASHYFADLNLHKGQVSMATGSIKMAQERLVAWPSRNKKKAR